MAPRTTRTPAFSVRPWLDASGALAVSPLVSAVDRLLGLSTLEALYRRLPADDRPFTERALEALDVRYAVTGATIPVSGPLIVVANHPFGGLDGLVLAAVLGRTRPDLKILANSMLGQLSELRDLLLPVNPFGAPSSVRTNAAAMRVALRWLRSGKVLAVFPAGEVSHVRGSDGQVVDKEWDASVGRLVRHAAVPVLPVFFHGTNSLLFRAAGRLHPRLRTALLPRELLKRRGSDVALTVGAPIQPERTATLQRDDELAAYLRVRTYALGVAAPAAPRRPASHRSAPVAAARAARQMSVEIDALPPARRLLASGELTVWAVRADEIPETLLEIGRLREVAFRATGEGSGRDRDLDRFDNHYRHLFVWNTRTQEVVGAYRMGATDEILPHHGVNGLYTSTLFRYDNRLLAQIEPALELGRAFVRQEYQRDYSPLMLLWKGIGAFVSRHPRYRMLFGPVSISNDYQSLSRQILARFLYATSYRTEMGSLVKPRNPVPFLRPHPGRDALLGTVVRSVSEVGALLAEIEADHKGIPVLLRQYLKLNATLLGFNIDPAFGNALDGLMLVDLLAVDRGILHRYLGTAGAAAFLAHHRIGAARRAS